MLLNNDKSLSVFLRDRRLDLGMSQSELSKKSGIKQATISNIENDPSKMTLATFRKLCRELNLEISLTPSEDIDFF